ncbi:hypothetical protein H072_9291 [Dactylellina haptotyla CBS 200.50]|uniref:Manganese/iron superoxide dismutase C-terminal domain-containing protein n=1 Tax=Dactylellina haptotyla (strain CBS 200.50) TaxID=1284197 RepID=S8BPF0_DACHA|nr:hypothetical protein H072_9291 [Dactylellina haptotyla CBS 200.50]
MPPPRLRPSRLLSECSSLTRSFTSSSSSSSSTRCTRPLSSLTSASSRPSILPKPSSSSLSLNRTLFTVPTLRDQDRFLSDGIGELYSANQVQIAWKDYQTHLTDRLNLLTAGTEYQYHLPLQLAIMTSRNSDLASIFNYASMAHNNHFYFKSLSPVTTAPGSLLLAAIDESFGHMQILKETMIATALACFSNAFVWLVIDNSTKKMRILTTYNSGTPYGLAHRRQAIDTNTTTPPPLSTEPTDIAARLQQSNEFKSTGDEYTQSLAKHSLPEDEMEVGRASMYSPLLCVNVWEHAWLVDYGFDKKEEYLENWWKCIDWGEVWARLGPLGFHGKQERPLMGGQVRSDEEAASGPRLADRFNDMRKQRS